MPSKPVLRMQGRALLALLSLLATLWACHGPQDTPTPPAPTHNGPMALPASFGTPRFGAVQGSVTEAGFALGKALFFDPALSDDSSTSCATCHLPEAAFADPGKAVSNGIFSQPTSRNSPTIQNLAWRAELMWDGRSPGVEHQPMLPIGNPGEMGQSFTTTATKVGRLIRYQPLTRAAYGSDTLTPARLLNALAQYMATLVSAQSPFDAYLRGDSTALSAQQRQGLRVFNAQGCGRCHTPPLFTDNSFRNNGLDHFGDSGRYAHTRQLADIFRFAVPTLRNAAKSAPYMHDGRFATLGEVLSHYRRGILASPSLERPLLPPGGLRFSDADSAALHAFLLGLTDEAFCQNPKFRP